jgi:hypothetical protein
MSLIKTYLHQQMIMNEEQLSKVKDQYAQLIMNNMDYKDMERLLFDVVRGDMEMTNEEELKAEIIDFYGDNQWQELTN